MGSGSPRHGAGGRELAAFPGPAQGNSSNPGIIRAGLMIGRGLGEVWWRRAWSSWFKSAESSLTPYPRGWGLAWLPWQMAWGPPCSCQFSALPLPPATCMTTGKSLALPGASVPATGTIIPTTFRSVVSGVCSEAAARRSLQSKQWARAALGHGANGGSAPSLSLLPGACSGDSGSRLLQFAEGGAAEGSRAWPLAWGADKQAGAGFETVPGNPSWT